MSYEIHFLSSSQQPTRRWLKQNNFKATFDKSLFRTNLKILRPIQHSVEKTTVLFRRKNLKIPLFSLRYALASQLLDFFCHFVVLLTPNCHKYYCSRKFEQELIFNDTQQKHTFLPPAALLPLSVQHFFVTTPRRSCRSYLLSRLNHVKFLRWYYNTMWNYYYTRNDSRY